MWKDLKFPLPSVSLVGRASNQAYIPSNSGARWKKTPYGITFAWSGGGEAIGITVVMDEKTREVYRYILRAFSGNGNSPIYDFLNEWIPSEGPSFSWCMKLKKYFEGKPWDAKSVSMIIPN